MIELSNGTRLVEDVSELPSLRGASRLFADYETTSFDDRIAATDPWHHCYAAGIAVTVDDAPGAWYVPTHHRHGTNLPEDAVIDWWFDVLSTAGEWCNANIKFDAHVSANCWGVVPDCPLVDTLTWAKLIDSDRQGRGGYGLDALARDWLKEDISQYEHVIRTYLERSKDYGRVPADVMAAYAGQDVMTTRRLATYMEAALPEQCRTIWATERDLTSLLYEIERYGMRVDRLMLQKRELQLFFEMEVIAKRLEARVGRVWDPASNKDCFDVLCNQFGLPVLAWTEEGEDEETKEQAGNPSFDKHALAKYLAYPFAPLDVITDVVEYRRRATHKNFFVRPYQELAIDDMLGSGQSVLHPSYNQVVRTGRMSCKKPNSQQLDKRAKELVLPPPGMAIVSIDDSQIEFRTIVHYINDPYAVEAYNSDPDTDFHDWVARMVGIKRRPAKTINFLMAFGGGKEKLLQGLESNTDLVGDIRAEVDRMVATGEVSESQKKDVFSFLARRKAQVTYDTYHKTLPGLKRTSRHVAAVCAARGYVFNLMGRRRHLPREKAHIAFNTLNQSSAADMMKARMVKLWKYLKARGLWGPDKLHFMAQVHDDLTMTMPAEWAEDPRTKLGVVMAMETAPCELRVPLRCAIGSSVQHWREACESATTIKYDRAAAVASGLVEDPLAHLA